MTIIQSANETCSRECEDTTRVVSVSVLVDRYN